MFALLDCLMTAPWVWHDMYHPESGPQLGQDYAWYHALDNMHRWMAGIWSDNIHKAYNLQLVYCGLEPMDEVDTDDEVYPDPSSTGKRGADYLPPSPVDKRGVLAKRGKTISSELSLSARQNPGFWVDCPTGLVEGQETMSSYDTMSPENRLTPDQMALD